MKLVFFCNYLNHHQVAIADALYERMGEDFAFVATRMADAVEMKGGRDFSDRPYCHCAAQSAENWTQAMQWAAVAEVAIFGAESQPFAICRARKNPIGLSFEVGERWLKRGWLNLLSPVLLHWLKNYFLYYRHANFCKLNSSGFAADDHDKLLTYRNRCFRWGYFTQPITNAAERERSEQARLLWVGRFVNWKHPEMALQLADRLKRKGYRIHLDMIGEGPMKAQSMDLCRNLNLGDTVSFGGNLPNEQVLNALQQHDLCLMTSDRNEGWGVVANEAMSCGCVLVASDEIGAVPYLIQDGENGHCYRSGNMDLLEQKVIALLDHPELLKRLAENGQETMSGLWSARNAADHLLQLIEDLQSGRECSVLEGPCSKENPR